MSQTGGIFYHRTHGPGRAFIMARTARARRQLDEFAEALAEGATITQAAASIGVGQQRGSQLFARIRKGLGWQAQ